MQAGPLPTVLRAPSVTLRPLREEDKADRLHLGRSAEYVRMVGGDPRNLRPFTRSDADRWYKESARESLLWAIEADGRCVGTARLHHLDEANRRARYAIGIFDPSAWGRGLGTEATRMVLRFAFETLGLHRVDLRVLEFNRRAITAYEKCGFIQEGVEREGALIADEWRTDVMMSILEQEYREAARTWWPEANGAPDA